MKRDLISLDEFCIRHNLEFSFMKNLKDFGMLEVVVLENMEYVHEAQLERLEKMLRLHRDLEINLEGIDTISYLLEKIDQLQGEVTALKNRLNLYE